MIPYEVLLGPSLKARAEKDSCPFKVELALLLSLLLELGFDAITVNPLCDFSESRVDAEGQEKRITFWLLAETGKIFLVLDVQKLRRFVIEDRQRP